MLLTIHNLPHSTRYTDVKVLLKEKCGITELILDNLLNEGTSKKVTVGLTDDLDASLVMRKINGIYIDGQQLFVEDVRNNKQVKSQPSEQPYSNTNMFNTQYGKIQPLMNLSTPPMMVPPPSMEDLLSLGTNYGASFFTGSVDMTPQSTPAIPSFQAATKTQQGQPFTYSLEHLRQERDRSPKRENKPYSQSYDNNYESQSSKSWKNPLGWNESRGGSGDGSRRRSRSPPRSSWSSRDVSFRDNYRGRDSFTDNKDHRYGANRHDNRKDNRDGNQRNQFIKRDNKTSNKFSSNNFRDYDADQDNRDSDSSLWAKEKRQRSESAEFSQLPTDWKYGRGTLQPQWKKQFDQRKKNQKNSWGGKAKPFAPAKGFDSGEKNVQKPGKKEKKKASTLLQRDETWRGQATSYIVKEVLKTSTDNVKHNVISKLKSCVKLRIDILLEEKIGTRETEIIAMYRQKYPLESDKSFLDAVIKNIEESKEESKSVKNLENNDLQKQADHNMSVEVIEIDKLESDVIVIDDQKDTNEEVSDEQKDDTEVMEVDKQKQSSDNVIVVEEQTQKDNTGNNQPKNETIKQQKKKKGAEEEFTLPEHLQKVLDEEVNTIADLYSKECENPDADDNKIICEELPKSVDSFKKNLTTAVAKRLLDIRTNLMLRIFHEGKFPSRDVAERALKPYGVIRVKKSLKRKYFVAHCDTFENYDNLCLNNTVDVEGCVLKLKPLHLTTPPTRMKLGNLIQQRRDFISSQIDHKDEKFAHIDVGVQPTPCIDNQNVNTFIENVVDDVNEEDLEDY